MSTTPAVATVLGVIGGILRVAGTLALRIHAMNMLSYFKVRRGLQREIERAEKQSLERAKEQNIELIPIAISDDRFLRDHYKTELQILESTRLLEIATRFGLDVSLPQAVYNPRMHGLEARSYFEAAARAKLRRMIAAARFEWWKKWIQLLIPILSLLLAIIVILKE